MKRYVSLLVLTLAVFSLSAQNLIEKYKSGNVKLVADKDYAVQNDWNTVFRSYYDTLYGKPMGNRKSLVVLPDGSVLVNHEYRNYHSKFAPNGTFEKELTIEKAGHKAVMGIINNNTLFTELDNMGKMTCSDINGKFQKTLTLNYMADDIVALNNGKFAVVGWVIWAKKFRSFVALVDYESNQEKVIWEHFDDRPGHSKKRSPFNYSVFFKEGGMISCSTMPYSKATGKGLPPQITTVGNELIVALPNTGEIIIFDLDGNQKSKHKIDWANNSISVEEQKKIQQKAIRKYKEYVKKGGKQVQENLEGFNKMIAEMEQDLENIDTPIGKPFFANIIKDSDGNILFFEIPKEKNKNVFHVWVYNQAGQFATECSFECKDYNLIINNQKMVFKDGYIYALQTLKNAKGNPLRLVRFSLQTE